MKNQFSKEQEKAVYHNNGPCLVLAGPGSGKTFVITNRLLTLITDYCVRPENILVITFTHNSAIEMKERFIRLLNESGQSSKFLPTFGTFHSVFYDILKNEFGYSGDSLLDYKTKIKILYEVLESIKNIKVSSTFTDNLIKDINAHKEAFERGEKYKPKYISKHTFDKILSIYEDKLFDEKKLDFADMIYMCYKLLKEHKDVLASYQEKFKYILIDEFQDINKLQYDTVKLLCKNKNLFVVGDDDQSIYKFRGSSPTIMTDFLKDYRLAKKVILSKNYRCSRIVVKFSKKVIDKNIKRIKKDLVANRDILGNLEIKAFEDANTENKYVIDKINEYYKSGVKYSDMAILYRTNILSSSIKTDLINADIPYFQKGETRSIFEYFCIKDIIAYMKLSQNENDNESLLYIANKPMRYISRDSISYKSNGIKDLLRYYVNNDSIIKNIKILESDLDNIKYMPPALAIHFVLTSMQYTKYLEEYCKSKNIDYEECYDYINCFMDMSIKYKTINDFLQFINTYKEDVSQNDENQNDDNDRVSLMTFHLSKGLEFKVVFIIDANDTLIPHKKSIKEKDIETERRLFYVGMTRAKDNLHIYFTTHRFGKNMIASRFITDAIREER